jgi:hypothetical protein
MQLEKLVVELAPAARRRQNAPELYGDMPDGPEL